MDGDTSATSTTLADADRVVVNDAGTMKQVALTDFETYMETSLDTLSNVTTVGALNSGSITSGFGAIDVGSSAITTTGTINFGSLADGSITATGFVDEDNMSSNSATLIPTQQSVKAYVDTVAATSNNVTGLNATGAELNTVADFSAVSVDTSTAIANNDAILMFDNGNEIGYRDVDLLDTYFSGTTKTLTNKTLTSPVVTGMHLNDSGFTVEGSGADGNETTVAFTNPTADHTITFPNATGNVAVFTAAPAAAIADGSNGQVLTTNGSGVLSFSDMASGADLYIANESSPANQPTAAGANAIGIGDTAQAAGADGVAIGLQSYARAQSALGLFGDAQNTESICIGKGSAVTADGAVQLGRNGYATAVDAVSLGKSRASGTSSFAAAIDNNTSTYGAQGTNSIAMGYQAKAAGTSSVAIGYQAQTTTANEIVLGGSSNQVKVSSAYTLPTSDGSANQVLTTDGSGAVTFADASSPTTFFGASEGASNATDSTAIGSKAKSDVIGKLAYSTFSFAGLLGQAQQGLYVLVADTTDATATVMTTNNSSASTDNQIILKNDSAMTFHGTIVARQEGDDGTDCAGWKIEGLIRREGAANTTTLLTEVVTTYYNAPNWDVSLTADTTNGGLKVEITGAASHDVRWVGTINTSELDYETYVWYGSRGIFAGGYSSGGRDNAIDYITIASTGNATDFGDLTEARNSAPASLSNGTRGVFAAGRTSGPVNTIDYITVASTGNATDFGDLTVGRQQPAGASNGSRGLIIAGFSVAVQARTDAEKLTIATTGNATLYSGTTGSAQSCTGWSNGDRAVFAIGYSGSAKVNTVEFLSIETEGNATDFGDLTVTRNNHSATGSTTRMLVVGGDT